MYQITKLERKKVINLLSDFNKIILRIMKMKLDNTQALGLLTNAMQINKELVEILKTKKRVDMQFVRQTISIIATFVNEIVSKWLFRYLLSPLWQKYVEYWTINKTNQD